MRTKRLLLTLVFAAIASICLAGSDPKAQALALYQAIHKQNWKALYSLAAFSPNIKKQLGSPDKFAADVKSGIGTGEQAETVTKLFNGMKNIKVGEASVRGNRATVPTSVDIAFNGQMVHFVGLARMVKEGQTWKWDLASSDDVQTNTSRAIQELIGKPQKSG